ncbi:MAG: DNA polymerase/3'-5' exonuclease PolX [Planctomycetes bacterium]|nr:DNA polymerase/3'-5' exonuclease PolX [Planctomycetota bacterium]
MDKTHVAEILDEVGTLLELRGENPFKCRAYHAAARTIDGLPGDLAQMLADGSLAEVKGIGAALTEKISELVTTGSLAYHRELRAAVPDGVLELLRVPGLGPKKVKAIHEHLGVASLGDLEYACRENRLLALDGFGAKSQQKILEGIERLRRNVGRYLSSFAAAEARTLYDLLRAHPDVIRLEIAGSVRRRKETSKDIDLVASAARSDRIMSTFTTGPGVESVTGSGETKSSVVLASGIAADLRVVSDAQFPCALAYFTGSKEHNVALRGRAQRLGLKLNEYGLYRGEEPVPCADEAAIYAALGLAYVPPELREDAGELEAAERRMLPELVERGRLRGVFHVHTRWSDGTGEIEEVARAAQALGFEYLGLSDHSQSARYARGLSIEQVREQWAEIDQVNARLKGLRILKGIESDILKDGALDYPDEILAGFEFVIGSVHSHFGLSEAEQTERIERALAHPRLTMLGHPTGRLLLGRDGYAVDMVRVIAAAARHRKVIEVNASPQRLDLDWRLMRRAKEAGVNIAINPDAHTLAGLADVDYGIGVARKGWLTAADVVTTRGLGEILAWLGRT